MNEFWEKLIGFVVVVIVFAALILFLTFLKLDVVSAVVATVILEFGAALCVVFMDI